MWPRCPPACVRHGRGIVLSCGCHRCIDCFDATLNHYCCDRSSCPWLSDRECWSFEIKHVDEVAVQQRCAEIFTDQRGGTELTNATQKWLRLLPWKCGSCEFLCRSVDYCECEAGSKFLLDEWIEDYEQHILRPGSDRVCNVCVKQQSVRIGSKINCLLDGESVLGV